MTGERERERERERYDEEMVRSTRHVRCSRQIRRIFQRPSNVSSTIYKINEGETKLTDFASGTKLEFIKRRYKDVDVATSNPLNYLKSSNRSITTL